VSQSSDERMAELRELFFESAQELLQELNDQGLKLEKSPQDTEIVRTIRRVVHTLKGDAAACGYRELSELAHQLEDALAVDSAAAHSQLPQVALTAADTLGAMIAAYRRGARPPSGKSLQTMIRELQRTSAPKRVGRKASKSKSKTTSSVAAPGKTPWTEYEELAAQNALARGQHVYDIKAEMDPHCGMPIAGRQLLHGALAALGEVIAIRPETGTPDCTKFVQLLLATDKSPDEVTAKSQIPTVIAKVRVQVHKPTAASRNEWKPQPSPPASGGDSPDKVPTDSDEPATHPEVQSLVPAGTENILRVGAERIDNVLNLVGQLIIGKSMFQQALSEFARHYPKDPLRGKFADAVALQSRVLNDLQRSVMKIRMVPVEQLFRRFPRIVRDVAVQCDKQVELIVTGEDTDLDKSILDAIAEPLTHLVRNAVGHGIENGEERSRLGKSPIGTIRLGAYYQGNQVVVEVSDDGCGIDAAKIKSKAVERGFIDRNAAARLSEGEILEVIFRPGFSTAAEVTEVSGRGVGMDVVQSVLQRLKGSVAVETRVGEGTTFRLKLPLTLAIIKALLFRVEQRLYAIPLNSVTEIARTMESEVHRLDNYEVLQLRNEVLPLVRLGRAPARDERPHKLFALVITSGDKKYGLIVDGLEGEEELVIKALDDQTISTDLLSGASILGDGRVVLILNLSAVLERFARLRPTTAGAAGYGLLLSQADRLRLAQNPVVQA
jgi:two-component system, chemotaxis family, sensor kinase CheA